MEENHNSGEPIVLGLLKKQKSSKPAFVIIVFLVLLGVCLGLPTIQEYLKDPNSPVGAAYNYIYSLFGGSDDTGEEVIVVNKDTIQGLSKNTSINYETINLSNVTFNNKTITYTIKSLVNEINLDEDTLYFEIYGSTNNLLNRIKLTGIISNAEEERTYTFTNLSFNASASYYGRIHQLEDPDYPDVKLNSGVATIKCTNANNEYGYTFENSMLKTVNHTYNYTDLSDMTLYMEKLSYYNSLAAKIKQFQNCTAESLENDQGLEFNAKLDLSKIALTDLGEFIDYNYYELDKPAKLISYEMHAKGYVCQ